MKIVRNYTETDFTDVVEVKSACYEGDFTIQVLFSDGVYRLVDFKPFLDKSLHPSITKYKDENLFKSFEIKNGNLNWNNYDLIFPLHELHKGKIA